MGRPDLPGHASGFFRRLGRSIGCLVVVLAVPTAVVAEEGGDAAPAEPAPRNRIDFGVQWFDAAEGDSYIGALNYSFVPFAHHAFAATLALVGSRTVGAEGTGIGDLRLQYAWVPSAKITAAAWVPGTLGMGIGVIVPTGDAEDGTGSDRWVVLPNVGWVWNLNERVSFLPTLQYLRSFDEGPAGEEVEALNLELGLLWVTRSEFWINYTPSVFRDFEPVVDTNVDHFLTFGKQFTTTFGSSLTIGSIERPPVQDPAVAVPSDEFVEITVHFVLP